MPTNGKVAVIIGASRGIGANNALILAENGYNVGICAKTINKNSKIGSITEIANTINGKYKNGCCIYKQCDVRNINQLYDFIQYVYNTWNRIDVVIYNVGAIKWKKIINTKMKEFDLMHQINTRGCFAMIKYVLPIMMKQNLKEKLDIIIAAPPIYERFINGKGAYAMTKISMSILIKCLATELPSNISICGLWPSTGIRTYVTEKLKAPLNLLREPKIMSDAVLEIIKSNRDDVNGRLLIDEDFLRERGYNDNDFRSYASSDENDGIVPRMMPNNIDLPSLKLLNQSEQVFGNLSQQQSRL